MRANNCKMFAEDKIWKMGRLDIASFALNKFKWHNSPTFTLRNLANASAVMACSKMAWRCASRCADWSAAALDPPPDPGPDPRENPSGSSSAPTLAGATLFGLGIPLMILRVRLDMAWQLGYGGCERRSEKQNWILFYELLFWLCKRKIRDRGAGGITLQVPAPPLKQNPLEGQPFNNSAFPALHWCIVK